ncbi:hypothetical protein C0J52_21877 [Blattella germanica]|nr:hypothetical protein C0J52_21877 [Blattella germanica]
MPSLLAWALPRSHPSPDLTPPDFVLWGYVKVIVYSTPVESLNELTECIFATFDTIRENREIFQRIRQSIFRRCTLCNEVGGRHFENLL